MLLLATETVSRTAIAALFYLIAAVSNFVKEKFISFVKIQGWGTLRFDFDVDEATKTAKILGIAYLSHSAFFVTTDVIELHNVIRYFLVGFYALLALSLFYESRKSLRVLNLNEEFTLEHAIYNTYEETFRLKRKLITDHCFIVLFYCIGIFSCLLLLQKYPRDWLYIEELKLES